MVWKGNWATFFSSGSFAVEFVSNPDGWQTKVLLTDIVLLKLKCFASLSWVTLQASRHPPSTHHRTNSLIILLIIVFFFKWLSNVGVPFRPFPHEVYNSGNCCSLTVDYIQQCSSWVQNKQEQVQSAHVLWNLHLVASRMIRASRLEYLHPLHQFCDHFIIFSFFMLDRDLCETLQR